MVRITFFIGNGFDINVGLATKYSEFYKYYIRKNPEDLLAKDIGKDYEFWADLELGLGKYTERIEPEKEDEFWNSEDLLEDSLADYLELQMERICVDTEEKKKEVAVEMRRSLLKYYDDFVKVQRQFLDKQIHVTKDSITYSFVSFNYTNVIDTCLNITKEIIPKGFGNHRTDNGVTYEHTIGDVLHIHGTTKEELILGVNDVSQISNSHFAQDPFIRQCMVKEEANRRFGQNKIEELKRIIDSSMTVCIFGMSIGKTDKMWWEYLGQWLMKTVNSRLIIFIKDSSMSGRISRRKLFLNQDKFLNKFKENSGMSNEAWEKVKNRVYVKYNSNIFNFKIVK